MLKNKSRDLSLHSGLIGDLLWRVETDMEIYGWQKKRKGINGKHCLRYVIPFFLFLSHWKQNILNKYYVDTI